MSGPVLTPLTDVGELWQIYRERMVEDFPRDELKPFFMMRRALRQGVYACYGMKEGETLLGYAFFFRQRDTKRYLFDYFAIDRARRDRGLGSAFLSLLREEFRNADCVVGEVEDPDAAEDAAERETRQRRLEFYQRNGCVEAGIRSRLFGVDYRVLELPIEQPHTRPEIREAYEALYRQMIPARLYRGNVTIE